MQASLQWHRLISTTAGGLLAECSAFLGPSRCTACTNWTKLLQSASRHSQLYPSIQLLLSWGILHD